VGLIFPSYDKRILANFQEISWRYRSTLEALYIRQATRP